jgi:hypothetical protein
VIRATLRRRLATLLIAGSASAALGMLVQPLGAQTVALDGPASSTLPSITPAFTLRANGFRDLRPLQVTVQIATSSDFSVLLLDSTFAATDTVQAIQVTRPLPSEAQVYWRARVRTVFGTDFTSGITGPRTVPTWITLISPNSPTGNSLDIRRPLFVWRAAAVTPKAGPWRFDVEITSAGRPELSVSGLVDTTFRPTTDLQANTSYRWNLRAVLPSGESVRVYSQGSFVITDPPLPTTTLLYQNFPNPFPSASAINTCFWFDVGQPGADISLDVLTLRGTLVRTIIPGSDGVTRFSAGRYGRGVAGAASNCDNRVVWDGTSNDGRAVAPGVYLARFAASNGKTSFVRIVFRGR